MRGTRQTGITEFLHFVRGFTKWLSKYDTMASVSNSISREGCETKSGRQAWYLQFQSAEEQLHYGLRGWGLLVEIHRKFFELKSFDKRIASM